MKKILTLRPEICSCSAVVVAFHKSIFLCSSGAGVTHSPPEQDFFGKVRCCPLHLNTGYSCLALTFSFSKYIAGLEWERVYHWNFSGVLQHGRSISLCLSLLLFPSSDLTQCLHITAPTCFLRLGELGSSFWICFNRVNLKLLF